MFALVVKFELSDGHGPAFDALVAQTVARIAAEESGTLVYISHTNADDPNVRIFYECYRDRDAFLAHEATDHTRRFLGEREQHLAAPPQVSWLESTTAAISGQLALADDVSD